MNQVNNEEEQAGNNIEEAERIELPREEITEEDQDLKEMFITLLESLIHSLLLQMEPNEKLLKARFDNQLKESAKRMLDIYLKEVEAIPEICETVYAMERAIDFQVEKLVEGDKDDRKKKSESGGNRGGRKLKKVIKKLRQIVAGIRNELYRRRQRRKAAKKEKEILRD